MNDSDRNATTIPEITPRELKARLDNEQPLALLDVREPWEREVADLPEVGQRRIPLVELASRLSELERDRPLVVYCRSGARSGRVVEELRARGFDQSFNLAGGVLRWREEVDPSLDAY